MQLEANNKTKNFFENSFHHVQISDERRSLLQRIADNILELRQQSNSTMYLNFICTHNSRRSQFAQVWSFFAAYYFDLQWIKSYSGGTSVTAFYKNTLKALQEAGFHFKLEEFNHQNPKYSIEFGVSNESLLGFSKRYDDAMNSNPFIAITTCGSADENCPFIPTALSRFHVPYEDPKAMDHTDNASDAYLNTSKQIAAEIYFLFQHLKANL